MSVLFFGSIVTGIEDVSADVSSVVITGNFEVTSFFGSIATCIEDVVVDVSSVVIAGNVKVTLFFGSIVTGIEDVVVDVSLVVFTGNVEVVIIERVVFLDVLDGIKFDTVGVTYFVVGVAVAFSVVELLEERVVDEVDTIVVEVLKGVEVIFVGVDVEYRDSAVEAPMK